MKKNLLLFALLFAGVFSLSAQYQRRVLIEEFTNASCPPCFTQNPGFNAVLEANHDLVTPVKYQTVWPGTDPMNAQNKPDVATRVSYYGVNGVPHATINGVNVANDCGYYLGAPACLSTTDILNASANMTPVQMTLSRTFSDDADSLFIEISVTSDAALTGNLRLHVAIIEEIIAFSSPPGTNGEKVFEQVMRKMLPSAAGTATGNFAANETKTYSFAVAIPTYIYSKNELGVSAWLQNVNTKEVYQSFRATPTSPHISIPSSNSVVCSPGASPSFTIVNEADEALTDATIRYRQGNNPWQDYDWTGNLAHGAAATIILSNVSITQNGINTIDVLAVSSNNGALQTNENEGYISLVVNGLFDPGEAIPYVNTFQSLQFPPAGWLVQNEGNYGWKISTGAGSGSTRSLKNEMYSYAGTTILTSPKIDLSGATGTSTLSFDHAYALSSIALRDSFNLEISNDCGVTWTSIYINGFQGMATAPTSATSFTPNSSQWEHHDIDVSSYNGSGQIFLRLTGKSAQGNNLYIDNLNISTVVGVKYLNLENFILTPNPSSDLAELRFGLASAQNIQLMVFDALGTLVQRRDLGELSSGQHTVSLDALKFTAGSYRVILQGKEGIAQTQWIRL